MDEADAHASCCRENLERGPATLVEALVVSAYPKGTSAMALQSSLGNGLLAALPPADLNLLDPHFQKLPFESDAVLVRTGDEFKEIYFPISGVLAFLVEMSDGHIVASTLMGSEGAVGALSVPSHSPVTATAYVAGAALQIPASRLQQAYEQSGAIKRVLRLHLRTQLLQLQNVAACNAVHPVEYRMADGCSRWVAVGIGLVVVHVFASRKSWPNSDGPAETGGRAQSLRRPGQQAQLKLSSPSPEQR